ncbi:hypothetical protein F9883_18430 [Morganella morganii]|uniref:hypothetical protein n=1 Tax=Morganella morganii TaxID=582 RepID=UPI0015F3B9AF|nr:hypothetical protein [Morganella morganii]MBA5809842.1 hypothetical protein [Morganella morganii]
MTQISALHLAAENTQPPLHMLTLQALNMIPPASFSASAISPQGIATTILSMVLKLVYKKMTEPKEVDVIGIIQETLMKNTSEWLESEYQAVRKDAESLQDAISSWQNSPTEEARQLIVVRNEIAVADMRRLCILSINTAKSRGIVRLCGVCALSCLLYFFTLRDTLVFGKSWGYASDVLEKYSKALTEQADIMFKDVLTAEINNYTENDDFYDPESQAKRSVIYWTSGYTNIQEHLTYGAQQKPTRVCRERGDISANPVDGENHTVYLGNLFLTDSNSSSDGSYNYLSAAEPRSYDRSGDPVRLPVRSAGLYHIRLYYAYMTDSLSFDYETQLKIEQAGKIVTDAHLTDLTKTVLTQYKSGSNYGPVIYRETQLHLEEGDIVLTFHEDRSLSGGGLLQHVEFVKV